MTDSIQKELAGKIATELTNLGFSLFKGIVYQIAPDYSPKNGELLLARLCSRSFHSVAFRLNPSLSVSHSMCLQRSTGRSALHWLPTKPLCRSTLIRTRSIGRTLYGRFT